MRSDTAAFSVLAEASPPVFLKALFNLHEDRIVDAIPRCIDLLTHVDPKVRSMAENYLVRWTGESFGHVWDGYDWKRPMAIEAPSIQDRWRAWWKKNRSGFRPYKPVDSDATNEGTR